MANDTNLENSYCAQFSDPDLIALVLREDQKFGKSLTHYAIIADPNTATYIEFNGEASKRSLRNVGSFLAPKGDAIGGIERLVSFWNARFDAGKSDYEKWQSLFKTLQLIGVEDKRLAAEIFLSQRLGRDISSSFSSGPTRPGTALSAFFKKFVP